MVMTFDSSRRPCDSEALATSSYEMNLAQPLSADTFVRAAVRVVLPWSTWPIVPTFTCGFLRSNFALAMVLFPVETVASWVNRILRLQLADDLFRLRLGHFL